VRPRPLRSDVRPWSEAITLGDLLLRASTSAPDADAVVFPEERLSYAELEHRARTLAGGLIGLGVQPRDRVGVLMGNSPDAIASIFAIALAGATVVPINTRYRAVELPFVVTDAGVKVILTSDRIDDYVDLLGLLRDAGLPEAAPALRAIVVLGDTRRPGTLGEHDLASPTGELEFRRSAARLRDDALLLYTSGTTSLPRGCRLTHEAIVRNWSTVAQILDLRAGDRMWAPCPLFHLGAIGPLIACTATTAAFLSDTWFQPQRALQLVQDATHLYSAYPPITQGLIDQPAFADADLSQARVMLNVGPADLLRQMQAAIPNVTQVSLYGSTEGGGAITYSQLDDDLEARVTTCGYPMPGAEVKIAPDGEILVRSFGLFDGYANDPEKTKNAFDDDGWYHTGDRGELDADGRLRFLGRLKDMLKVGGENVAAAEIESVLSSHPSVKLVQAVGVPDPRLEEVPAVFVELKHGTSATQQELIAFCAERFARFKVPRYVRFVDEWPMSATKIQKGPLRDRLMEELTSDQTKACD
jgi:acyl-CoA synthetase (AMP-forming)/AMP-acid ligase II